MYKGYEEGVSIEFLRIRKKLVWFGRRYGSGSGMRWDYRG